MDLLKQLDKKINFFLFLTPSGRFLALLFDSPIPYPLFLFYCQNWAIKYQLVLETC